MSDAEKKDHKPGLHVDAKSLTVEKFKVESRPFTQLSDHFGLSIVVNNY